MFQQVPRTTWGRTDRHARALSLTSWTTAPQQASCSNSWTLMSKLRPRGWRWVIWATPCYLTSLPLPGLFLPAGICAESYVGNCQKPVTSGSVLWQSLPAWIWITAQPLASRLMDSRFLICIMGNNSIVAIGLLWVVNKLMHEECSEELLAYRKFSVVLVVTSDLVVIIFMGLVSRINISQCDGVKTA